MEALPLPQTKQSRWHNSTRGLTKQPRRRSRLGRPEKGCTSLTPCKAALPNQASACLVGHPPAWKNLVLTWLKLVWLDLPAARPCGHWRNSTHGLAKQPRSGVNPQLPARLPCQISPLLAWFDFKSRTYLAETGVAGPPRCLGAALWRHCHKK